MINRGKVKLPTWPSEQPPSSKGPKSFLQKHESAKQMEAPWVPSPIPAPSALSLRQSRQSGNSGLVLNPWKCILSWKYVGFLTQADAHSEEMQAHRRPRPPACPSPRRMGQRGCPEEKARGGSLPLRAQEAGVFDPGFPYKDNQPGSSYPHEREA